MDNKEKKELLIDIVWLTRWYKSSPSFIFDKFDFKLMKNDFCFICWKSWVWKTTLSKFLTRQLNFPRKMIFYKKEDLSRFSNREVQKYRRKVWVIYQDYKLINRKTVKENIIYPLEICWEKTNKINQKLNDILYKIWLFDKKDILIPYLSWWEKQRVSIARALISNPEFIIADEPTWNLDFITWQKIMDILIDLNKIWNTILFITHDISLIEYAKTKIDARIVNI